VGRQLCAALAKSQLPGGGDHLVQPGAVVAVTFRIVGAAPVMST